MLLLESEVAMADWFFRLTSFPCTAPLSAAMLKRQRSSDASMKARCLARGGSISGENCVRPVFYSSMGNRP
jgi:hypothetical protein